MIKMLWRMDQVKTDKTRLNKIGWAKQIYGLSRKNW